MSELTETLPVVALRGMTILPDMVIHFDVSRERSVKAIEEAMQCFDSAQQAEACRAAAESLCRKYAALPPREARAKLSQALARRGFGWESISGAVEAVLSDVDPDE